MLKTVAINLKCAGCDALLRKETDKKEHVKNVNVANDFSPCLKRIIVVDDILIRNESSGMYNSSELNDKPLGMSLGYIYDLEYRIRVEDRKIDF